jgi:ABC-type Fe3+-hydroxamate transport system substrate-binding protein
MKFSIKLRNTYWVSKTLILSFLALACMLGRPEAGMMSPPPQKIDVIIIGDRVVDIAYNLGVLPTAMSVRASMWPMAKNLKSVTQILGCPMRTTVKKKETIPEALTRFNINRVIAEKSDPFCLYKPEVKPENIAAILAGTNITIEYVDFSEGLESAVRQTARLVNREKQADAVIAKYKSAMAAVAERLPKEKSGKKVIIFNGTYQSSTGKSMLRVEAPDGYSDRFLLSRLGCINAGDAFKPADGKPDKGYYPVRKTKSGMVLKPLIAADPDVIVMTGDSFATQKALSDYLSTDPNTARIKAIRNMAVYALPEYVDSGVLEYPGILQKWAVALAPDGT